MLCAPSAATRYAPRTTSAPLARTSTPSALCSNPLTSHPIRRSTKGERSHMSASMGTSRCCGRCATGSGENRNGSRFSSSHLKWSTVPSTLEGSNSDPLQYTNDRHWSIGGMADLTCPASPDVLLAASFTPRNTSMVRWFIQCAFGWFGSAAPRSSTTDGTPYFARSSAVVRPVGPPPLITTRASSSAIEPYRRDSVSISIRPEHRERMPDARPRTILRPPRSYSNQSIRSSLSNVSSSPPAAFPPSACSL
mmetsp:Transcript_10566/g.29085  ORF Transcript_10566/g.29085 Transcript_10566/m.29085 type:complete len:251 (+) Transcript_10566:1476-2228(+)